MPTVYISSQLNEAPYILDKSNTTYILKEDLVAGQRHHCAGDHVVLDLNGYSVTFGENAL